jgi:hypothetical protein
MSPANRRMWYWIGGGVAVVVLMVSLWCGLKPATIADRIAVLNLGVLAVTAGVIGWYTLETRRLREVTARQATLQVRPFLSMRYSLPDRKLWLHNIGRGVAREIQVHDVRLTEEPLAETHITVEWTTIDFIREGDEREVVGTGQWVVREQKQAISRKLRSWMSNFGPHGKADYEFVIDYRDLTGTRYRAAFGVSQGVATLRRDDTIDKE